MRNCRRRRSTSRPSTGPRAARLHGAADLDCLRAHDGRRRPGSRARAGPRAPAAAASGSSPHAAASAPSATETRRERVGASSAKASRGAFVPWEHFVSKLLTARVASPSWRWRSPAPPRPAAADPGRAGALLRHARSSTTGPGARAAAHAHAHALHVVVLRRPARGRVPQLGLHRLHQHRRQGQARRVQPQVGRAGGCSRCSAGSRSTTTTTLASSSSAASSTRSPPSTPATSTRATATAACSTASPSATAALGRAWGGTRTVPLEAGCGLGYTYPNPVVSGKRLYLFMRGPCWYPYFTSTTDGKQLEPAAHARARPARLGPATCGRTRSTTARAGRLDPDDVLRRAPGLVREQPLLHALQGRPLLQGRRVGDRDDARPPVPAQPARHGAALLGVEGPAVADGHRVGLRRRAVDRLLQPRRVRRRVPLRALGRDAGGSRGWSPPPAARCSATATAASRSTTPTRAGSC